MGPEAPPPWPTIELAWRQKLAAFWLLAQVVVVEPSALGFAIPHTYRNFKLVAYGQRYV